MDKKEKDIVLEVGDYWVTKADYGYDVYRAGICVSTRCARIGYKGQVGIDKARAEIARRTASED